MSEPRTEAVYIGPIRHSASQCATSPCNCWCEACIKRVHGIGAERIEELTRQLAEARQQAARLAPAELDVERLARVLDPDLGLRSRNSEGWRESIAQAERFAATYARLAATHVHQWVDARNEVVASGEMCPKCGAVRAAPEPEPQP